MFRFAILTILVLAGTIGARGASLSLEVNPFTGQAWIANNSTESITFDGYTVQALEGELDPAAWVSFQDFSAADPTAATAVLGNTTWEQVAGTMQLLAEVNLASQTVAAPGFRVPLGMPIGSFVADKLLFTYLDVALLPDPIREVDGLVEVVPEPSTWLLAGCGALALGMARRRKRS